MHGSIAPFWGFTHRKEKDLGYKKYVKDYEIEYRDVPGKKRQKAFRVYVGPYFRFRESKEEIEKLKKFYLIGLLLEIFLILFPMCFDSAAQRSYMIALPQALSTIPLVLAGGSVWRIWTAKEKVEREHADMIYSRMSGASLFLMIFHGIGFVGSILYLVKGIAETIDIISCLCNLLVFPLSVLFFVKKKGLKLEEIK